MPEDSITLYYVYDPMCSWCYGFSTVFNNIKQQLPANISVQYILGGLAADTSEPMSADMKKHILTNWKRIEKEIPGVTFNYDFWEQCQPRRSTYPSCRAVIAAKQQNASAEIEMISVIQRAYYQQARNPSDDSTLIELAAEIGLATAQFEKDLNSDTTNRKLKQEIDRARALHITSLPSLVLQVQSQIYHLDLSYTDAEFILHQISQLSADRVD